MEGVFEDHENLKDFLEEAELQQYYELFRDTLKVAKVSQLKFVVTEDLIQIGLSKPEQRRYKKVYSKYFPNPYISKIKKLLSSNKKSDAVQRMDQNNRTSITTYVTSILVLLTSLQRN